MSDERPPKVTLEDVGTAAGVSTAAASLALRGKPGVGEATRQRILKVAADLNYHVRPGKDHASVGDDRLAPHHPPRWPSRHVDGPLVSAITGACADAGADIRLGTLSVDDDDEPIEVPG